MRLVTLRLRQAPGLPEGLPPLELGPGLNVVLGPNGSGKSTLARTLRALLWSEVVLPGVAAHSTWADGETARAATLLNGHVSWEGGGPTLPPAGSAARHALGLAELIFGGPADQALAHRLQVELSQGYDLAAALSAHRCSEHLGGALLVDLNKAQADCASQLAATRELAAKDRELEGLLAARERAFLDTRALGAAEQLLQLALRREDQVRTAQELQGFPDCLDALKGTELERLDELQQDLARHQHRLDSVGLRVAAVEAQLQDPGFVGEPPTPTALDAASRRCKRLEQTLSERRSAERSRQGAAAALHQAARRVLAHGGAVELPEGGLDLLESLLAEARQAREARDAQRAVAEAWGAQGLEPSEGEEVDLEGAVAALRAWLVHPEPIDDAPRPLGALALALLGLVVLVAGLATDLAALTVLGAAVCGLGLGRSWHRNRPPAPTPDRSIHEDRARRAGVEPSQWDRDEVKAELDDLEARLASRRQQDVAEARHREARALEQARDRDHELSRASLGRRLEAAGLDPGLADLELHRVLRAVAEVDRRRTSLAGAQAEVETLDRELDALRAGLDELLLSSGLEEPPDDTLRLAAVADLVAKCAARATAHEERDRLSVDLQQLEREVDHAQEQISGIWAAAEVQPGDVEALGVRLDRWAAQASVRERHRSTTDLVDNLRAGLDADRLTHLLGGSSVDDIDSEGAHALLEQIRPAAKSHGEASQAVAEIETELRRAREGTTLSDARAHLHIAEQAVREERDRRLQSRLTHLVLSEARRQHQRHRAPPVLKRAQEWFGRFTHHGWGLEVDPSGSGSLVAIDRRTTMVRSLSELSDATRIQLLLAARLAAIDVLESGASPLPLCLDEVLSSTDPARFSAVGGAILELAQAGRQVLYFTADPTEAAQWKVLCEQRGSEPPRIHVLDGSGAEGGPFGAGSTVRPGPVAEVPRPGSLDPDAYARCLGVPAPDGLRPSADWHLIHLLHDDLETLHACLLLRVDRLGPWRAAREAGALGSILDPSTAAKIDARGALLEAVLEAWRVGRGRPPTWAEIRGSGCVGKAFTDRVRDLLPLHPRDPAALLAAIGALPRFHSRQHERLRAHLQDIGCLDPAEVLPPTTVLYRALAAVREPLDNGTLSTEEAIALVESWLAALETAP